MQAHSNESQFLDPVTVIGLPAPRQRLETVSEWLKTILKAVECARGTVYRPDSPGVSIERFGWNDLRRVFYASRFEKDGGLDVAVAYVALRDGRLVGIHTDFHADGGLNLKGLVHLYLWSRDDWDAFMDETAKFTDGGGDDEVLRKHVALCGTVID